MGTFLLDYNMRKVIISSFLMILVLACDDFSFRNGINHGKIEYAITYPGIAPDNFMLDVMPKRMETTFMDNSYRNDIVAGMGLIKTSIILKEGDDKLVHAFKAIGDKHYSELGEEDLKLMNPQFQNIEIKLNDDIKEIAGYKCMGADVTVSGDSTWSFKLFYTNEINIRGANSHTPFKDIDGVLMEYEINSYDTHMKFTAEKVAQIDVSEEEIDLEEEYKIIEPSELKKRIEEIFNKVK